MSATPSWLSCLPSTCMCHVPFDFRPAVALPPQFPNGLKHCHEFGMSMADLYKAIPALCILEQGQELCFFHDFPTYLYAPYLLFFEFILLCFFFFPLSSSHISKAICLVPCKKQSQSGLYDKIPTLAGPPTLMRSTLLGDYE